MTRKLRSHRARAAGLALLLVAAPCALAAEEIMLQPRVVVAGSDIRLSDLFVGIPPAKDAVVDAAPEPGSRNVYLAAQLLAYARAHGIAWRPTHARERLIVERSGQPLGLDAIRAALMDAAAREIGTREIEIEVQGPPARLFVALDDRAHAVVRSFDYDTRSHRFSAIVAAGSEPVAGSAVVNGRVHPLVQVPVPIRHVMPGETIARADIEWRKVRLLEAGRLAVSSEDRLVGLTPRVPLTAGEPVRTTDVVPLYVVQKGETVTILLRTPVMTLSATGTAQERGARGDTIRVLNTKSKRAVEAVVLGPGQVQAQPPRALAAIN